MPQMWTSIYTALGRARRWAESPEGPKRNWKFYLDPTPAEYETYLATRSVWKEMAVDIETPRTNPLHIDTCGVSIEPYTAMVTSWIEPFISMLRAALQDPNVVKSGHNFGFDERGFMAYDCDVAWPIWNTIEAESILRPPFKEAKKRRWLSLKPTCLVRYFDGVPFFGDEQDPVTRAFFRTAFPDVPEGLYRRLYCGCDALWTRLLRSAQRQALEKAGMLRTFIDYVAPSHPTLVRMEHAGMPVDEKRRKDLLRYVGMRLATRNKEIQAFAEARHKIRLERLRWSTKGAEPCEKHPRYTGATKTKRKEPCEPCGKLYDATSGLRKIKTLGPTFMSTSDDHWRWLLFAPYTDGGLGLIPLEFTGKKKVPQVDKHTIEALQRGHPDIVILTARVELKQLLHTEEVLKVPVDENGRAHFAFSQHRTETQRLASGKDDEEDGKVRGAGAGNVQNKKDLERSILCAGDEDFAFFEWDLKQIELEVMAWLARDLKLIRDLRANVDVHSENAAAIFECGDTKAEAEACLVHFEGMLRPARQAGKKFTHRANYGGGDKNAGRMYQPCAKWSLTEVGAFIVKRWTETQRRQGVSPETIRRLLRGGSVEHSRLYDYANTLCARSWREAYFKKRPGLLAFQNLVIQMVERDGFLTNSFGYRLKFWNFEWKDGKRTLKDREEALAFWPQSDVAFMSKVILKHKGEMWDCCAAHGGELLFQNHDAFGGRIPKKSLENFRLESRPIVERAWPELGRLPEFGEFKSRADFMVGWNWGKKHAHSEKCGEPVMKEFPWAVRKVCDKVENLGGLVEGMP
jgi:hypothetical protein